MLKKIVSRILGCALLLYGGSALAFTLITLPEQASPSNTITDATTLQTEVQPIVGTIRSQIFGLLRPRGATRVTRSSTLLAANAHADVRSDPVYLAAASDSSAGSPGGGSESLWISAAANSLENEFFRTAFHGATHNLLAGFDMTRSNRYVLGVSFGHEASNYTTTFNFGDQRVRGFSVNPYFAYLLSDAWSVDVVLGYGDFDTRQSRALGTGPLTTIAVTSEFASTRAYASANLTHLAARGNWKLVTSLGLLASRREIDGYVESLGGSTVASAKQDLEQWNLLGELAYGRGASETFVGLNYEEVRDRLNLQLLGGEQPANDTGSVLLTAGWRHFGRGLTTGFTFSRRLALDQVKEYGVSMVIRADL